MRIAVLSDFHGNLTALEAVAADLKFTRPELVLQGGDIAFGGHRAAEVVDFIRAQNWPGVLGNTDEMLWRPELRTDLERRIPKLASLWRALFEEQGPATIGLLGDERLAWLRTLPDEWRSRDAQIGLVHASPGNLWTAPGTDAAEEQLRAVYGPLHCSVVVYGHIHRPYVRSLPGLNVANSGSVGLPYDGDPRASYLLIDEGKLTIRRIEYDVDRECRELLASSYPLATWIAQVRRKGSYVPPES